MNAFRILATRRAGPCVSPWAALRTAWLVGLMGALGLAAVPAASMTVERQGDTVFASGPVTDDLLAFERALGEGPVRRVVFVESPGGDLWTGLRVGRLLAERGVDTVVAGSCISACAIMFLGGRERRFADAWSPLRTVIGLHGAHRTDTRQVDPTLQPQIYAWFKDRMGARFDGAVMNRALYEMDDHGALLRLFDRSRDPQPLTTHCRSRQTPRSACTELPQHDALSLGVITHAGAVRVELPPAFRSGTAVLGQALGEPEAHLDAWLGGAAALACRSDNCRTRLLDWPGRREHWALAIGAQGGWGRSEGRDTPQLAALNALYRCNHRADGAHLCVLHGVNGRSTAHWAAHLDRLHQDALAGLKPPAERTHANEEFGGGRAEVSDRLRTQRLDDITPSELPGVRTVVTGELAALLAGAGRPVLVDVSNHVESLPGSMALWAGGQAFDDPKADEAMAGRFQRLLALLAPDRTAPVVFYCSSRNCWASANAARRAVAAGWRQVLWYRGGLEAWRAAGLPLVPPRVRAVAY